MDVAAQAMGSTTNHGYRMKEAEPAKTGGIVAALAALWVGAHVMPLLLGVPPAGAVEAIGDEAVSSTSGNFDPRYAAALAVSIFSVLPVPGMFGFGGGGDVYRDAEKRKNGFGFKSVDDAVNAARGAKEGGGRSKRGGKGLL